MRISDWSSDVCSSDLRAWRNLRDAALGDDIVLDSISGYRSHAYQLGIFERKRARGQDVDDILTVNAAPGYSEHHSGPALDIGTPGEPPPEQPLEGPPAFARPGPHPPHHGLPISYPRDPTHDTDYNTF